MGIEDITEDYKDAKCIGNLIDKQINALEDRMKQKVTSLCTDGASVMRAAACS